MDHHDIFSNPSYTRHGPRKYSRAVDGRLCGFVLATISRGFDSPALNKTEYDDLVKAKRDGRISEAVIIVARYEAGALIYCSESEAESLEERLRTIPLRSGRYGDFWVLDHLFGDSPF
jgi:hypothetical protein